MAIIIILSDASFYFCPSPFIACDGSYGDNCATECACGVGAEKCDPVSGCVCKDGWGGPKCADDEDECSAAINPCSGDNVVCVNQPGRFSCQCKSGFEKNDQGECIGECILPVAL